MSLICKKKNKKTDFHWKVKKHLCSNLFIFCIYYKLFFFYEKSSKLSKMTEILIKLGLFIYLALFLTHGYRDAVRHWLPRACCLWGVVYQGEKTVLDTAPPWCQGGQNKLGELTKLITSTVYIGQMMDSNFVSCTSS